MIKSIHIGYNDLFKQRCEFAVAAGFKDIAINFTGMIDKTEDDWKQAIEDIQDVLDKTGLSCIQSHPYYYDLMISSEITEERCEFAIKQAIIASAKLGAKWCALHPRSSVSSGFRTSKSLEDNRRDFATYLEVAKKYGTEIAAENLPIFAGIRPVMPFYASNYEDLMVLVDSFCDDSIGICWDTGHANMMHFDQSEVVKLLGSRIKCTHIHNNFGEGDPHSTPDSGNIKWTELMAAFKSIGYEGPFTLETGCKYPDPIIQKAFMRYNYDCLCWLETMFK